MSTEKRGRGRPRGPVKDDSGTLKLVARLMVREPKLKATTAMRRVLTAPSDAVVRRLQIRWKNEGPAFLEEAKVGQEQSGYTSNSAGGLGGGYYEIEGLFAPSAQSKHMDSVLSTLQRLQENPVLQTIRRMEESPTMRLLRQMEDNPTLKALRQIEENPTLKVLRRMEEFHRISKLWR